MNFTQPWGFSKLDVFRSCPRKFKYQFIDKLPQGSSPAMERGARIHDELEGYLRGWQPQPPAEVMTTGWGEEFEKLKAEKSLVCEQALGLTKNWSKLPDWFGKATWLRAKMDAQYIKSSVAVVIDFKTGKFRVPSEEQVLLYSVVGQAILPGINEAQAEFWYVDQKHDTKESRHVKFYTNKELMEARKYFEGEAEKMYNERRWGAKPSSNNCRWCPYSKSKGGPCEF